MSKLENTVKAGEKPAARTEDNIRNSWRLLGAKHIKAYKKVKPKLEYIVKTGEEPRQGLRTIFTTLGNYWGQNASKPRKK